MKRPSDVQELYDFGATCNVRMLTEELVEQYENYLRTEEGNMQATIYKKLNIVRQLCRMAIKKEWLARDPFLDYEMGSGNSIPSYNTVEEMDKLYRLWKSRVLEGSRSHLHAALRRYLIRFFTGQHFTDSNQLKKHEIVDTYGRFCFGRERSKNSKPYFVPLLGAAMEVINEEIDGDRETVINPISNQKDNQYLKELMAIIGCKKKISCKAARHSFASMLFDFGLEEATVSKMIGHSTRKTMTQHYIHINKSFLIAEIDKLEAVLEKRKIFK